MARGSHLVLALVIGPLTRHLGRPFETEHRSQISPGGRVAIWENLPLQVLLYGHTRYNV